MDKKFYEAPEMELLDLKLNYNVLLSASQGGDPPFNDPDEPYPGPGRD